MKEQVSQNPSTDNEHDFSSESSVGPSPLRDTLVVFAVQVPVFINSKTGERYRIGIVNRERAEKGTRVATPVGGAASLNPSLSNKLVEDFGVVFTRGPTDAIFFTNQTQLPRVMRFLREEVSEEIDKRPEREVLEELGTLELPGQVVTVLTEDEIASLKYVNPRIVDHSSIDDQTGVSTEWTFYVWEAVIDPKTLEKILQSPLVYGYPEAQLPEPQRPGEWAQALDGTPLAPALKL